MYELIYRQEAIDALTKYPHYYDGKDCVEQNWDDVKTITNLPTAHPRRGSWIESNLVPSRKGKPGGRLFICSECNKGWVKQDRSMEGINFCPHCGADMRKETEDAEVH